MQREGLVPKASRCLPAVAQGWFAMHGPLLQRAAAKDSLWHRVLSGLAPPAAGEIARGMVQKSGNAKIVMRQAFRSFKNQCAKVLLFQHGIYAIFLLP